MTLTNNAGTGGLCDANVTQHSGYYKIDAANKTNENYFYWMFESRNDPKVTFTILALVWTRSVDLSRASCAGGVDANACS